MKRNKIVIATLLSAGLILGTTSAAFAVDSTPTASVVTTASFNTQVAAYNTSLVALDTATATFKTQAAAYATAVQVYKTSYTNALATYKAILKANSPATTAVQYTALVAAYNTAMTAYTSATITFKAQLSAYQAAVVTFRTADQSVLQGYKAVSQMREQLTKSINTAFDTAVHAANVAFAIATRKAAVDALGAKLVKPVKVEIKVEAKEDGFKFDRPVRPIRPAHLIKPTK